MSIVQFDSRHPRSPWWQVGKGGLRPQHTLESPSSFAQSENYNVNLLVNKSGSHVERVKAEK